MFRYQSVILPFKKIKFEISPEYPTAPQVYQLSDPDEKRSFLQLVELTFLAVCKNLEI